VTAVVSIKDKLISGIFTKRLSCVQIIFWLDLAPGATFIILTSSEAAAGREGG
jgi:hypothetical protein